VLGWAIMLSFLIAVGDQLRLAPAVPSARTHVHWSVAPLRVDSGNDAVPVRRFSRSVQDDSCVQAFTPVDCLCTGNSAVQSAVLLEARTISICSPERQATLRHGRVTRTPMPPK